MTKGLVIVVLVVMGVVLVTLVEVGLGALFTWVWSCFRDRSQHGKKQATEEACGFGYEVVRQLRPLLQILLLISFFAPLVPYAAYRVFEGWLADERIFLIGVTLWAIAWAVFFILLLASARLQRICLRRGATVASIRKQVAKLVIAFLLTAFVLAIITWSTSDSNWHNLE